MEEKKTYNVELSQGKVSIIDFEDKEKVMNFRYKFYYHHGYAVCDGGRIRLHNLIMDFDPNDKKNNGKTIDHINRNPLDNRKRNLRIVNNTIQSINRNKRSDNKYDVTGIQYRDEGKHGKRWVARWSENKKIKSKSFSVSKFGEEKAKQMSIDYRNKKIEELEDYREALKGIKKITITKYEIEIVD